jgi:integrase
MSYEKMLKTELKKLPERGLPKEDVTTIRDFIEDLNLEGISHGRQYAYVTRLRRIASIIPDRFLNPSERDVKNVVSEIKSTKVRWGHSEEHLPTENGLQAYLVTLKRFYKWHLGKNKGYPECVEWIKIGNAHPSRQVRPESLITQEEVNQLIEASRNTRDKAIFSTLYDSGIRLGELLSLRIRDIKFDDYGVLLSVTGKTGPRQVRVVGNSVPYLRQWLNVHPVKSKQDALVFCNIDRLKGNELTEHDIYSMIRKVSKRAGVKRRIHPHLFRHSRATILASQVMEAPLESQMGWVHGSKQTKTYVHLSLRDQDNAILKAYGIKIKEDETIKEEMPKECPRCHRSNPSTSLFCNTCGMPLDVKTTIELDEKRKEVESMLIGSSVVDNGTKELLKTFDPEFKDKLLEAVLSQIVNNPQLRDKFRKEIEGRQ